MKATFGDVVSPFAVEKISMAKDQKVIIAIISKTINISKVHFVQGVGYFHCFEGKCCEELGIPIIRYGFPTIKYETDGKIKILGNQVTYHMLAVGYTDYQNLITKDAILVEQGSSLLEHNVLVTCTEEQYQKKTYDVLGPTQWKTMTTKDEYQKFMSTFVTSADQVFGRKIDQGVYELLISSAPVKDRPQIPPLEVKHDKKEIEFKEEKKVEPTLIPDDVDFSDLIDG